jgi:hypothetical protein
MLAIARDGSTAGINQEAMSYAKASVPDAIKRLGPVGLALADLAVAKIGAATAR